MFATFERQSRSLVENAFMLAYYSNGGLNYHEALLLTPGERDIILEVIEKINETKEQALRNTTKRSR